MGYHDWTTSPEAEFVGNSGALRQSLLADGWGVLTEDDVRARSEAHTVVNETWRAAGVTKPDLVREFELRKELGPKQAVWRSQIEGNLRLREWQRENPMYGPTRKTLEEMRQKLRDQIVILDDPFRVSTNGSLGTKWVDSSGQHLWDVRP